MALPAPSSPGRATRHFAAWEQPHCSQKKFARASDHFGSVLQKGGIMKLTGKKALITGGNSGIGLPQPDFSLRRARRSPLPVATRRRSMKRSQN